MSRRTVALLTAFLLTATTATTAACGGDDNPTSSTPGKPDQVTPDDILDEELLK